MFVCITSSVGLWITSMSIHDALSICRMTAYDCHPTTGPLGQKMIEVAVLKGNTDHLWPGCLVSPLCDGNSLDTISDLSLHLPLSLLCNLETTAQGLRQLLTLSCYQLLLTRSAVISILWDGYKGQRFEPKKRKTFANISFLFFFSPFSVIRSKGNRKRSLRLFPSSSPDIFSFLRCSLALLPAGLSHFLSPGDPSSPFPSPSSGYLPF